MRELLILGFVALSAAGGMIASAATSSAAVITYTDSFVAGGTLGGVGFSDADVVVTVNANTADVTSFPSVVATSASVHVNGLASATFTDSIGVAFDNFAPSYGEVFISDGGPFGELIVDTASTALVGYNLTTSIGPVISDVGGGIDFLYTFPTTSGPLKFTSFPIDLTTFTATTSAAVIPEPSAWAMMLLGFAGLGFIGFRSPPKRPLKVR